MLCLSHQVLEIDPMDIPVTADGRTTLPGSREHLDPRGPTQTCPTAAHRQTANRPHKSSASSVEVEEEEAEGGIVDRDQGAGRPRTATWRGAIPSAFLLRPSRGTMHPSLLLKRNPKRAWQMALFEVLYKGSAFLVKKRAFWYKSPVSKLCKFVRIMRICFYWILLLTVTMMKIWLMFFFFFSALTLSEEWPCLNVICVVFILDMLSCSPKGSILCCLCRSSHITLLEGVWRMCRMLTVS